LLLVNEMLIIENRTAFIIFSGSLDVLGSGTSEECGSTRHSKCAESEPEQSWQEPEYTAFQAEAVVAARTAAQLELMAVVSSAAAVLKQMRRLDGVSELEAERTLADSGTSELVPEFPGPEIRSYGAVCSVYQQTCSRTRKG
jgi:hypothetical protein